MKPHEQRALERRLAAYAKQKCVLCGLTRLAHVGPVRVACRFATTDTLIAEFMHQANKDALWQPAESRRQRRTRLKRSKKRAR